MNTIHNWANSLAIGLLVLVVLFGGHSAAPKSGNVTQSFWDSALGYKVNGTSIISAARALSNITSATFSGTLTQSTSNTATTTAALGCIQTTATSTATPVKFTLLQNGLAAGNATSTFGSGAGNGLVSWSFGTCP